MPAYNEEQLIGRAVQSILDQTYRDFELVVVDDGSTDGTWGVLTEFDDPRIRAERSARSGLAAALNRGLSLARGEYVARMDADDESLPGRLERQVDFLDAHPEVAVLGSAYVKVDAMRGERYVRVHPLRDAEIRRAMARYIPICHGSVMFRRQIVEAAGGYDPEMMDAEDLELWLRVAPYGEFANLPVPLYVYRFDPAHSYFESTFGRFRRTVNKFRLSARAVRSFDLPGYEYLLIAGTLAYSFLLPRSMKRLARRLVSSSRDVPLDSVDAELPADLDEEDIAPRGVRG